MRRPSRHLFEATRFRVTGSFKRKASRFLPDGSRAGRALAFRVCVVVLAVSSGAAGGATLASNSVPRSRFDKRDCAHQFGSFSVGHWPPACWRAYGTRSPFNTPIPSNPRLAADSTAIVDYMRSHRWSFEGDEAGNFIVDGGGNRPVYWSQKSDPLVRVTCRGSYPCRHGMQLRIPSGAQPQRGSDAHMTVVDQAKGLEHDFWQASKPEHGELTVSAAKSIPIGAGSGTGLGGGAEAAQLGLLGGLIRARELAAGKIEHALTTTVECVQYRDVWPSPAGGHGDTVCAKSGTGPHFASLVQLDMSDAQIAATRAPRWQQAIMKAMAHYGIYVVDTNGPGERDMSLLTEDDKSFTSFGYPAELGSFVKRTGGGTRIVGVPIDVSRLRVIAPCVARHTC
jgi:hypothetical protein